MKGGRPNEILLVGIDVHSQNPEVAMMTSDSVFRDTFSNNLERIIEIKTINLDPEQAIFIRQASNRYGINFNL